MNRLVDIVRYPVKGLPGVKVAEVEVRPGSGLQWDRSLAIENGSRATQKYFKLAMNSDIARFKVGLLGDVVTVATPAGDQVSIDLAEASVDEDLATFNAVLPAFLPRGSEHPPRLIRTTSPVWEVSFADISVINLATVRALGHTIGEDLDPRRFRANIYLDGPPAWEEFTWMGKQIRIGDATFEVIQPTDRCKATTVNPDSASYDINIPGTLVTQFGHMFFGVYARVVKAGTLTVGAETHIVGTGVTNRRGEPAWPRAATIMNVTQESDTVRSLWIEDPIGLAQSASAGQHLRVHLPDEPAPSWRSYTVSGVERRMVRLSVKRDGAISACIHKMTTGDRLVITGPFGDATLELNGKTPESVVLISAGIGLTPSVAILRKLVAEGFVGPVRVLHVDRGAHGVALWNEVVGACSVLGDARASLHVTSQTTPTKLLDADAKAGRPQLADFLAMLERVDTAAARVFVCGPVGFASAVLADLRQLSVPRSSIVVERFYAPSRVELDKPRTPTSSGPHVVTTANRHLSWIPSSGSLLEVAEAEGFDWKFACRVGACGSCMRPILSGEIEYLVDPTADLEAGQILTCCSVPLSDLVLG